jgi:hypothetical protein
MKIPKILVPFYALFLGERWWFCSFAGTGEVWALFDFCWWSV